MLARARKFTSACSSGRVVYSTCSLNPVECEAVVLAAIWNNPQLKLIDSGAALTGSLPAPLQCCLLPGLTTWQVPSSLFGRSGQWADRADGVLVDSMFPCKEGSPELTRCTRVLPVVPGAPCGGFFLAMIERQAAASPPAAPGPVKPMYQPLSKANPEASAELQQLWSLDEAPHADKLQLACADGQTNVIALVPDRVLRLHTRSQGPQLVGCGCPAFIRMPAACEGWAGSRWRLTQAAAQLVGSKLRLLLLSPKAWRNALVKRKFLVQSFIEDGQLSGWQSCKHKERWVLGSVVVSEASGCRVAALLSRDAEGALQLTLLANAEVLAWYLDLDERHA